MSKPKLTDPNVKVEKPRFNVYTMMLVLSFIAVCIACLLLYLELDHYQQPDGRWPWDTKGLALLGDAARAGVRSLLG